MVAAIRSSRNWLSARLHRHPFFTRVAVLVGGTAFAQALSLLAMPALTRLYGPADFGVMQVYASLLAAAVTVVSLRFELALPLGLGAGRYAFEVGGYLPEEPGMPRAPVTVAGAGRAG